MCGIIGGYGASIKSEFDIFRNAIKLLAHRGPDNQDVKIVNDNLILGHTRLSIIDLDTRANQPIADEKGNMLVFNGEIYNYKELKNDLKDYKFKTSSDTEVLLYLLDKYDIDFVLNKLNGMFAFLYWDKKQERLIAARDRIGKKPLFFTQNQDKIYFSSEAKVFSAFGIDFDINKTAIINFLFDRRLGIKEDTFFSNVQSIENSHYYIFKIKSSKIVYEKYRYYSLKKIKTDFSINYQQAKLNFNKSFTKSLDLRMRSDVPIAFMLSGGLDSSAILSKVAFDNPSQKFTAISAIYPNTKNDESEYAQSVIDKYGNIQKEFIVMNSNEFFEHLDKTIYAQETPIADGSMVAHNILMKKISQLGIKVILSGNGGDEVLAGYNTHQNAYYAYLLRNLKFNNLRLKNIKYGLYHILPSNIKQTIKNILALKKNFLKDHSLMNLRYDIYNEDYNDKDIVNFYLKMSLDSWTIPGFVWYEDRNAMQYGIENRDPFLDYKLIETMLKIPGYYKLDYKYTKKILRDSMKNILPKKILNRQDKKGFHSPINKYEKYIDYQDILNDIEFKEKFDFLNIDVILKDKFIYRWRLFSIHRWYKLFIKDSNNG